MNILTFINKIIEGDIHPLDFDVENKDYITALESTKTGIEHLRKLLPDEQSWLVDFADEIVEYGNIIGELSFARGFSIGAQLMTGVYEETKDIRNDFDKLTNGE